MQPKVYHVEEHQIDAERIDDQVFYVIEKLRSAGYSAYLVGGGVRDLLLKKQPKDFDLSTSAKPEEIRALFRNAILIGRRFRLAHIRFGRKIIEVSTFRAGATEDAGLIIRDNKWGSEEEDVLRRDFTINGLFYDPKSQQVIDYVDGYLDLEKRVLRTIGQPTIRFTQDPVRMIRLIKFCARFDFRIEPLTFEALLACKGEILKSSSARILEELLRMLESGASKIFFHLLNEYGLLKALSPPLSYHLEKPDNLTLKLLGVIDDEIKKNVTVIDRSVLIASLIFGPFCNLVEELNKERKKKLHLGEIFHLAQQIIDDIFTPFFKLPRRFRGITSFILTSQYRFTPIDGRKIRTPKAPKDDCFPLSLHLLKLRSIVFPELLSHYALWTEVSFTTHENHPQKKRRRPRYRRKKNREKSL